MIVEKEKIRFIVDIVDHCNLNCKCCGHFSPLAPKGFLDINTFERDLKRLHELLYGHIHCFELMGGESLLHPRLYDFIFLTAKYVTGEKYLCTNGVLLSSKPDEFYQLCAETDTIISITMYPIDLNWDEINRKVKLYGTKLYTSDKNSIDIFKAKDIEEIVEFLNRPIPCCRYCLPNQEEKIPWGVSKRDISEWF